MSETLDPLQTGFGTPDTEEELARLIDRLAARVGFGCVLRIVPHDTHIPEYAALEVRADAPIPDAAHAPALRCRSGTRLFTRELSRHPLPLRPVKLFVRPEPIEAVAEVPDGPPVRFRWRHVLHEVAAAEGPERIAMEWWRDETGRPLTRDYFRIESREGVRALALPRRSLSRRSPPELVLARFVRMKIRCVVHLPLQTVPVIFSRAA